ncbi:oxidoreductase [Lentzea sp. NBRC 105346]|uniref:PQQ-dependent sugar dehydrogenase n=1 Tax=Lentzea sp. NBRC 105346 TaxID=3032205 RepID=UPI0024A1BEAA|nr:PQQ-dependent sugar dehydrogenase [Lentzea sp. NBRC 105346]GLZ33317.1 oxidoreductase [Lentzea sp. NBRC 105346]
MVTNVVLAAVLSVSVCTPAPAAEREIATGLTHPWAIGFLPDGSALFTERDSARIMSVRDGVVREVQKIAEAKPNGVQSGLLGIAVSPKYVVDKTVFIYYSTETDNRIASLQLGGTVRPIVTGIPLGQKRVGGRLAFGPDGLLYATTGDAQQPALAQDPKSLAGKVLRMRPSGKPVGSTLVYSLGHRDPQGITWDPQGRMFVSESGESTFDELNRVEHGRNYGWPVCEGKCGKPGFVDPIVQWSTSEATPSDLGYFKGNLYMAGNIGKRLWKIPVKSGKAGTPEALFTGKYGKLRAVELAPDGTLWFSSTNGGGVDKIVSFTP